jgi:uncharacterized membrane protein YhaH (DUF805 family)
MNYYFSALRKYAVFSGRARRSEFWCYLLFNWLIAGTIAFITWFIVAQSNSDSDLYAWAFSAYLVATTLPTWAVAVRRLHDVGLSGWFAFAAVVPFLGPIFVLAIGITDSQSGPNRFGPNPKGVNPLQPDLARDTSS